jgi:hypothetical protein
LLDDAIDALVASLESLDITVGPVRQQGQADVVLDVLVDDRTVTLLVQTKAYCTAQAARELIHRAGRPRPGVMPIVVAERITVDAREALTRAGWSWLDRRGRLHLRGPAIRVDEDVHLRRRSEAPPPGPAISGRSGISVAYWLLAHPRESLSPTGHRRELRLAPSTVSTSVRRLIEAGLVDEDKRALVPELFWELAAVWRADRTWLATAPDPSRHTDHDPHAPRWRRGGTAAAAAWGAPVVTGEGGPVELYVPGPVEVSIAARRYGVAEPGAGAAVLTVAPAAPVCAGPGDDPHQPDVGGWPVAPKLVAALDLAQDRARGREILDDWRDSGAVWR